MSKAIPTRVSVPRGADIPAHDRITQLEARVDELERFVILVADHLRADGATIAIGNAIKVLRINRPAPVSSRPLVNHPQD